MAGSKINTSLPSLRASSTDLFIPTGENTYVEMNPILNEHGNIKFNHGPAGQKKTFVIKFIKQQIGNEKETNIDLSYFTKSASLPPDERRQREVELNALIDGAKKAIDAMNGLDGKPADLTNARSFTLNFTQEYTEPSLVNRVGDFFKLEKLKFKPKPIILETISYKETATSSEEKTFTVNLESYDAAARNKIQKDLLPLNSVIRHVANKSLENLKPLKYKQPDQVDETTQGPIGDVDDLTHETDATNVRPEDKSGEDEGTPLTISPKNVSHRVKEDTSTRIPEAEVVPFSQETP